MDFNCINRYPAYLIFAKIKHFYYFNIIKLTIKKSLFHMISNLKEKSVFHQEEK